MQITNVIGLGLLVALSAVIPAQAQDRVGAPVGSARDLGAVESAEVQTVPYAQEDRSLTPAPEERRRIPHAVRLYEAQKDHLPPSGVSLDVCKILERYRGAPRTLLPDEVLAEGQSMPCRDILLRGRDQEGHWVADQREPIVAFDFWCTAGIEDAGPDGPHFSRNINPVVTVEYYADGIVIYGNHCKKADVPRTPAGEAAAEAFLERVQSGEDIPYDIRGERFGTFQRDCFPVVKGD